MWQYTTETIINSTDRFHYDTTNGIFIIDGATTLRKDDGKITVYKSEYVPEVNAEATLTVPNVTAGDTLRLKVVLRQQGLVSSIYQNAYLKHNKPLFFEVKATGTATDDAEALVKAITKQLGMSDFKFFTATNATTVITLTAADCYVRFVEISLDKIGAATGTGEALLGFEDYVNVAKGTITKVGTEGNGTVRQLIKNLRIPTGASVNPFGADQGGKPVPGGKYDQYLVEYVTDRRHVGGQVMGALDQSLTSHIFFINTVDTNVETEFEKGLAAVGVTTPVTASLAKNANAGNVGEAIYTGGAVDAKKTTIGSVE
jgi:hypothetical protein